MSEDATLPTIFEYILFLRRGRAISDEHWEEIEKSHIDVWHAAAMDLKTWTYSSAKLNVTISANWQQVPTRLQQMYRWRINVYAAIAQNVEPELRAPFRPAVVPLSVAVEADDPKTDKRHVASHHIDSFLYDVFLLMNLAAPGSCDMYKTRLRAPSVPGRRPTFHDYFDLSDYSFDLTNIDTHDGKWPAARCLPLDQVITWYKKVRIGISQIPNTRMEKVMFALMHIARGDVSVNMVVWLFYGLETFFDARPGENFRMLVSRIDLWLSPTEQQKALLNKNLRALYNIRSSFVHGGRDVIHPLHNEAADQRVNDQFNELMSATEFGFSVLLASVQEAIVRGWTDLRFSETVSGTP